MTTDTHNTHNTNHNNHNDNAPTELDNANEECVGPTSNQAGKVSSCDGCPNQSSCAAGAYNQNTPEAIAKAQLEQEQLYQSLRHVSHIIMILSGKGGVGKSTIATQLALTLSYQNYAVGILDVDLCGPSIPQMIFGKQMAAQQTIHPNAQGLWIPVYTPHTNLAVMSINFLLGGGTGGTNHQDQAVIWRGPRKNALIQQFITQVDWTGPHQDGLDYLIIDTPPGTSDEHISTVQYIQQAIAAAAASNNTTTTTTTTTTLGAIVITTPEEASLADVRKELSFCQKTNLKVYGMIENMATMELSSMKQLTFRHCETGKDCTKQILEQLQLHCPELLTHQYIISSDLFTIQPTATTTTTTTTNEESVVATMAKAYNCPYWGTIPMDRTLLQCCDDGTGGNTSSSSNSSSSANLCFALQYPSHTAAKAILHFCERIVQVCPVDMIEMETS